MDGLKRLSKLIVTLEKPCDRSASFRLFDKNDYWSTPYAFDFDANETVGEINLKNSFKGDSGELLDPSHIYIAGFWTYGGGDGVQIRSIELVKDPTGNVDIEKDRDVLSIEYVSPTGMVGSQPFEGVNMVRTVYTNGDVVVSKEFRVYK